MIYPIVFLALIYFTFLLKVYIGLNKIKPINKKQSNKPFVTVIIPFRNEEDNLLNSIKSIENIKYPKELFEVIYVNDNSVDNSLKVLQQNIKSENIKIIEYKTDKNNNIGSKKRAVNFAISHAKGSIIATTDADCIVKPDWLDILISYFDDNTAFVSGAVKFNSDGSLWNRLQQLEFSGLVLAGGGLIMEKKPTICNAANLAFKKDVFYEVGGYSDNLTLSSGDDELLMQKIANTTNYKIKFCFENDSVVSTNPNKSIREFYNQRKRWASKGVHYKDILLVLFLVFIYLFFLSIPSLVVFSFIINTNYLLAACLLFVIKYIIETMIIIKGKEILIDKFSMFDMFIAELLHIPYILMAGFLGLFGNFKWKDRKLKR